MRSGSVCKIKVGDVIDLTDADVTYSKFTKSENLRIVLKTERQNGFMTLFAGKEAVGFHRAKVVSIDAVVMSVKKYNGVENKQFTNVYVTLEDTDEMPNVYAKNTPVSRRTDMDDEWVRPEWKGE